MDSENNEKAAFIVVLLSKAFLIRLYPVIANSQFLTCKAIFYKEKLNNET